MSPTRSARSDRRRLARVVAYYATLAVVVYGLARLVPAVSDTLATGRLQELARGDPFAPDAPPAVGSPIAETPWSGGLLGAISMLGALAIMVPVTWIYMITRRRRGYDESVVHTLLILPVAVTGIVMIVQNSLALAFSLAGIVAAVRFRTTLEDTKDAVYVFLAIGVGLASGVQALGLALVLSLVFNAVVLVLWASRFGNAYAVEGGLELGDVLAGPASAATRRLVGDAALLDAAAPADLRAALEQAARLERHLAEERAGKKSERANVLLLVHARTAGVAQAFVDAVLDEVAARWRLAEVVPAPEGRVILEYLARLDGPAAEGAVLDRIANAPEGVVDAAELRALGELKPRR